MGFINAVIRHGSNDISDKTISYIRNVDICSGIGTLELSVIDDGTLYDTWDTITIHEEGHKKGIFYISQNVRNQKDGSRTISAEDGSKKLVDYFIPDTYVIDYESYTGYWIEKFLTEAKVSYTMPVSAGVALSNNTQLGLSSAYDTIMTLLQYSNWYLYFDGNGKAIVGSLEAHSGSPVSINDNRVLSVMTRKHDGMLRNRAVVWGNYDTTISGQIFADLSVNTPWNYDSQDKRAVVISNSAIPSYAAAEELARKLLNEFARINYEKTIEIEGEINATVGDFLHVKSMGWSGTGLITNLEARMNRNGLVTTVILDQRCPRLFAFWGEIYDYVYIGTDGSGVWRKPLTESGWEDFSTGLASGIDYEVSDLYINSNVFGAITGSGTLYHRQYDDSGWVPYVPSGFKDENDIEASGLLAVGLTINHQTNNIIAGFNNIVADLTGEDKRSWVAEITPSGGLVRADIVNTISGGYNWHIYDLDTNDVNNVICGLTTTASGTAYSEGFGQAGLESMDIGTHGPKNPINGVVKADLIKYRPASRDNVLIDGTDIVFISDSKLRIVDMVAGTYSDVPFVPHTHLSGGHLGLTKKDDTTYYISRLISGGGTITYTVYTVNIITGDLTLISTDTASGYPGENLYVYTHNNTFMAAGVDNSGTSFYYAIGNVITGELQYSGPLSITDVAGAYVPMFTNNYCYMIACRHVGSDIMANIYTIDTNTSLITNQVVDTDVDGTLFAAWFGGGIKGCSREDDTCMYIPKYDIKALITVLGTSVVVTDWGETLPNVGGNLGVLGYMGYHCIGAGTIPSPFAKIIDLEDRSSITYDYYIGDIDHTYTNYWVEDDTESLLWVIDFLNIAPKTVFYDIKGIDLTTGGLVYITDISWLSSELTSSEYFQDFQITGSFTLIYTNKNTYILYNYFPTGKYNILKQTKELFEDIYQVYDPYMIELSKSSPLEIYNITASAIVPSGLSIFQSDTLASGEFSEIIPGFPTYDGRLFDIQSPSGFTISSGAVGSGLRYFGVVTGDYMKAFPVTLSGSSLTIATISGANHLETSNYTTNPYIFISGSGIDPSGLMPTFWQRDPSDAAFVDYSSGLPSSRITIIRLDDII